MCVIVIVAVILSTHTKEESCSAYVIVGVSTTDLASTDVAKWLSETS